MFPQNRLGKEQGRGRKVRWPRSVSTVVLSASSMAVGPSPSRLPAMGFRVQNPGLCVRHVSPCGCACGLPRGGPWGGGAGAGSCQGGVQSWQLWGSLSGAGWLQVSFAAQVRFDFLKPQPCTLSCHRGCFAE